MRFEVFIDSNGEYRWRLRSTNRRIIAESGEGYQRKNACYAAIKNLKERVLAASIIEV
jgi:uncharacterized protein YegP (UPF0339 family)